MGDEEVQWGIDYRDGSDVYPVATRYAAESCVAHYNKHREDEPEAVLVSRTITTTPWEVGG